MTSDRPYRRALKIEKVKEELLKHAGTQFDPLVADAAIKWLDKIQTNEAAQFMQTESYSNISPILATDGQTS
jgi:HD-GYP domain-containing protein (c-di-GMP phosphodiesterase class II)